MSSEIGDLFVTLRAVTDPWSEPLVAAADLSEEATSRIIAAGDQMAASLDASSKAAADSFRLILDAAEQLAAGIVEPLNAVKTAVRQVATAIRALSKASTGLDDAAVPAFEGVSASAEAMASGMDAALATARASMASLGAEFGTVAGEAAASATEITTASTRTAAATTEASGAAAASSERSAAAMGETSAGVMKYATGLAAAGFGLFEAIKGATKFNAEMTHLNTLANVSKGQLKGLGDGVLNLAGQVGQNPDSLAESLYHVESAFASTGITGAKAMDILKVAAEGASIGHANLIDVQNALDAAVVSGIPGVENYSQAMGALNAIVGSGDMQMQDLADAMGTGMVAVVKGYGLSLNDVGAALATFGDNNIRGAKAGTDLRMAVQALSAPVKSAAQWLLEFGMKQDTLAKDMQKGGLSLALTDLQNHFKKSGITATQEGAVITDMFGKKAGAGLAVLMGQYDRFESKYPELQKGAYGFATAWATASHTLGQEWSNLRAGLEALAIKIGTMLMPTLSKVLNLVREGVSWITQHKTAVQVLASVLGGLLVAALWGVVAALAAIEVNPVVLGITAVAAAAIYAWTHFRTFRTVVMDVAGFLRTMLVGALHVAEAAIRGLISWFKGHGGEFSAAWRDMLADVRAAVKWFDDNVIKWVQARVADLVAWWSSHSAELAQVWSKIWLLIATEAKIVWDVTLHPMLVILQATWRLVWMACWDTVKIVWSAVSGIITFAMHLVLNVIGIALDLLTGHWGKAWQDVKKLVSQGLGDIVHLITSVASGFGTLLYDAGANIVKGLISGIKSMISGAGSAISSVASTIRKFLPFSPAKEGPLSGSGSPDIAGAKIGSMVADGITASTRKVGLAAHGLAGAAAVAIGGSGAIGSLAVTTSASAAAAAAAGGSGSSLPPIVVNVDGRKLFEIVQTQALRNGRRNPTTGITY